MNLKTLALAGAFAISAAGASLAQPAPGPGAPPPAGGPGWQRPDPARMAERHADRMRAVLQLRPDQEPALRALMDAMRPSPEQMQRRQAGRGQPGAQLTTPQRLDRMQQRMAERQQQFARRADAIKRFYAQLTPTQQRAFDALHQGRGGMGGRGHGMRGGGMMGMGHGMMDHGRGGAG